MESSSEHSPAVLRWTLVATILASGIVFLDSTVVNVALPAIARDLGVGLAGQQWIVNGYVLTLSSLLILGGSLGDLYGRRQMMIVGLVVFGLASLGAGLAPSMPWLVAARLFQGVGGALLVPGSLAILRATFAEGAERGRAIGLWSGWSGITTLIGPLVGGWLVDTFSWRLIFYINVPIIALTLFLLVRYVPESRGEAVTRPDWLGAAIATLGLTGLAYGLIQGPVAGWTSPLVVAGLLAGGLGLVLFIVVERRAAHPMMPLKLFRSRNFSVSNLTTLGVYFALYGWIFVLILYVQNVMGYSALLAGLILAPFSLMLLVLSPALGKLAGQRGPRLFMAAGPLICALGLLTLLRLQPDSSYWTDLFPGILLLGGGMAILIAPLSNTVLSSVPDQNAGLAAAINNAVSRVAALLGVALLGVVVTAVFGGALDDHLAGLPLPAEERAMLDGANLDPTTATGLPLGPRAAAAVDDAYTQAFHWAMLLSALAMAAGGVLAGLAICNPRRVGADRDTRRVAAGVWAGDEC